MTNAFGINKILDWISKNLLEKSMENVFVLYMITEKGIHILNVFKTKSLAIEYLNLRLDSFTYRHDDFSDDIAKEDHFYRKLRDRDEVSLSRVVILKEMSMIESIE